MSYSVDFGSNKELLRQQGHRDYTRQQWSSAEFSIIAISKHRGEDSLLLQWWGRETAELA